MPEAAALLPTALAGLALIAVLALLTWLVSLRTTDVSLVDRLWSVFIVGAGWAYAAMQPALDARGGWMLGLATAWAVRLCFYVTRRNWGHGEDRRYQEIRARNQPGFAFKSLYLVFGLQTVLAWIVSAPLLVGILGGRPWGALDTIGAALTAFGIVFEAVADAQMAGFKAGAKQHGQVMDQGLWRYSRHPNYFGEACTWWGLGLMALGAGGLAGSFSLLSPLVMTVLLLRVSGVALLEKDIAERRPAYRDYIARTNAFLPGPPRSG